MYTVQRENANDNVEGIGLNLSTESVRKARFYKKLVYVQLAVILSLLIALTVSITLYAISLYKVYYKTSDTLKQTNNYVSHDDFNHFIDQFNKTYNTKKEYDYRFSIFKQNVEFINQFNSQLEGTSYLKMNQFGDLSNDEFSSKYLGYSRPSVYKNLQVEEEEEIHEEFPEYVNWKDEGCVTPVKDQGPCGSCWAFSTTGSIESAVCIATGELYSLSEQQLVDCDIGMFNMGCNGGTMDTAYEYVQENNGLCKETDYPYEAIDDQCQSQTCTHVAPISGFKRVKANSVAALKKAVYSHGPISVALDGGDPAFRFYNGGVLSSPCAKELDHAVLLVGYGYDESTDKYYWLVKNSWGTMWGMEGYIKLDMHAGGPSGECGILLDAIFPYV